MKLILLFLVSVVLSADTKPAPGLTFGNMKAACTLSDSKLILSRAWPFGSWEDCAYALLTAAQQLDNLRDKTEKELSALKQAQETQKKAEKKPAK